MMAGRMNARVDGDQCAALLVVPVDVCTRVILSLNVAFTGDDFAK